MKIENIINDLKFVDDGAQMICLISEAGIKSRIYVVAQVQENIPGVELGDREPHNREKTVGIFLEELKTFGNRFKNNHFLLQSDFDIDESSYEFRYYKLTSVELEDGEVVLKSNEPELKHLREFRKVP